MIDNLHALSEQLRQPEYLHVLMNPLPVYGLLCGLAALVLALAQRSRPAQVTALSLILISSAAAWPAYALGQRGYNTVYLIIDDDGKTWLDAHKHRAQKAIYLFAGLAVVAMSAIILPSRMPKTAFPLIILTLLLTLGTLAAGGWVAKAGGKARHREFREKPPPENSAPPHASRGKTLLPRDLLVGIARGPSFSPRCSSKLGLGFLATPKENFRDVVEGKGWAPLSLRPLPSTEHAPRQFVGPNVRPEFVRRTDRLLRQTRFWQCRLLHRRDERSPAQVENMFVGDPERLRVLDRILPAVGGVWEDEELFA
jgi:hypothetical protein